MLSAPARASPQQLRAAGCATARPFSAPRPAAGRRRRRGLIRAAARGKPREARGKAREAPAPQMPGQRKASRLIKQVGHELEVTLWDGRVLAGVFLAFDRHLNLVLRDCRELCGPRAASEDADASEGAGADDGEPAASTRTLGTVIVRGSIVESMSVGKARHERHEDLPREFLEMRREAQPAAASAPVNPYAKAAAMRKKEQTQQKWPGPAEQERAQAAPQEGAAAAP